MGVDDCLFLQALGAGGADTVHGEGFRHGGPDIAGHTAQGGKGHDNEGQHHIIEPVLQLRQAGVVGAGGLHARHREPAQIDGEYPDKDNGCDKYREAVADNGGHLHGGVPLTASVYCAEDAQGDGDAQAHNCRKDIDENGILHGDDQHVLGGAAISIAPAQVALEDAFIFAVDWPHS